MEVWKEEGNSLVLRVHFPSRYRHLAKEQMGRKSRQTAWNKRNCQAETSTWLWLANQLTSLYRYLSLNTERLYRIIPQNT